MERKIFDSVDYFKFFAAYLVVAIHTHPFAGTPADFLFTCLCRIAVPFFFVANSFFFFSHESPNIKKYNKRLITIYILWFMIELPLVYYRFFIEFNHPLPLQLLFFLRSLFFSNTFGASWFLTACIISVNLVYWLSKKTNIFVILLLSLFAFSLSLSSSYYYGLIDNYLNESCRYYHKVFSQLLMPANSFIVALLYIVMGKVMAERKSCITSISVRKLSLLLVLCLVLGGLEIVVFRKFAHTNDAFIMLPLITILLFTLLLRTSMGMSKIQSKFLRDMSILIYLIHPIIVFLYSILGSFSVGFISFIFTAALSSLIAMAIIVSSTKYAPLKKLY